jgi:TetR/AcrR family transcriptional repressor of mexJK operon
MSLPDQLPSSESSSLAAGPAAKPARSERGPGRPPLHSREDRLNALFDSAATLLGGGDYGAFSIDAVAKGAGMAKKTVYTLVASKEELIKGVIAREVSTLDLLLDGDIEAPEELMAELRKFLLAWAGLALSPIGFGIYLMAVANRDKVPAIATILETHGLSHALNVLRSWLERPNVRRMFAIDDMDEALNLVSSLLISQATRTASLSPVERLTKIDIEASVAVTIKIFNRCYRVR